MKHTGTRLPCALVCLQLTLATTTLHATENDALAIPVTTIRLKPESAQLTPETITIIDNTTLDSGRFYKLQELIAFAPGVRMEALSTSPQAAAISIRGVSNGAGLPSTTALSMDGVYIDGPAGQNINVFDFERVEIARGPQSTYQGATAIGGAINIQRTLPTGKAGVKTRLSLGQRDLKTLDTVINFPIAAVDGLAAKVSLNWADGRRNNMSNALTNRDENNEDRYALATSFRWQLNDNMSLQYTLDIESDSSATPALLNLSGANTLVCASLGACTDPAAAERPETGSLKLTSQNFSNERTFEGNHHTFRGALDLANHTVTAIIAWRDNETRDNQDLDANQFDFYATHRDIDSRQVSEEIFVTSQWSTDLSTVIGVYLRTNDDDLQRRDDYIYGALGDANRLNEVSDPQQARLINSSQFSKTVSAFGHLDYALNAQWQWDFGARWQVTDKRFNHQLNNPGSANPVAANISADWRALGVSSGLSYKVDDQAIIYMRYAFDEMPGGFDALALSEESAQPYGAQSIENFEAGMKTEWLDDHLRINLALFSNKHDDKIERSAYVTRNDTIETRIDNVSQVKSQGYEMELEATPLEQLYLRAVYTRTSTRYADYKVADLTATGANLDLSGLTPPRTPSHDLYLTGRYASTLFDHTLNLSAGYHYTTAYRTNPLVNLSRVENYNQWDFSADYLWDDWRFRLFVQNFNDNIMLRNTNTVLDAEIAALPANSNTQQIVTYAEANPTRYSGLEIIYTPEL